MARGRKPDKGTHEARDKINQIVNAIEKMNELSTDAKNRVIKAVKFGLGIKNEKPKAKKETENITQSVNNDEPDTEYFQPKDCYVV